MNILAKRFSVFCLSLFLMAGMATADSAAAVKELGAEEGTPIDKGFFFWEGQYIQTPYVVERRGVDTYINGHLIRKGPEYPPFDPRVSEDPGDPPPNEIPYRSRPIPGENYQKTYWPRKGRYLFYQYGQNSEKAIEKMIEAYRKSPLIKDVKRLDNPLKVRLVMKDGKEVNIWLYSAPGKMDAPPPKEHFVQQARKSRAFYELMLNRNIALFAKPGREVYVQGQRAVKTLEILTSDKSEEEKIEALKELEVVEPGLEDIVYTFRATPQLAQRLEQWKSDMARQTRMKNIKKEVNVILEQVKHEKLITDPADMQPEPYIPPPPTKTTGPRQDVVKHQPAERPGPVNQPANQTALLWVAIGLGVVVVVEFVILLLLAIMLYKLLKKQNLQQT